jgi:hypothetical protein
MGKVCVRIFIKVSVCACVGVCSVGAAPVAPAIFHHLGDAKQRRSLFAFANC